MKKAICKYCGTPLGIAREFCGGNCEERYKNGIEHDSSLLKYFIAGIMIGVIVMLMGVFTTHPRLTGAGIGIAGITAVLLPFTTPETIELLGYVKARIAGRILGIVLILVAVWVGFS